MLSLSVCPNVIVLSSFHCSSCLNTVCLKGNRDSIKALPRKEVTTPKGKGTRTRIEEREKNT